MPMNNRTQAATVHLIAAHICNGVRCGASGSVNATTDLPSVTCKSCLNLQRYGRIGGPRNIGSSARPRSR